MSELVIKNNDLHNNKKKGSITVANDTVSAVFTFQGDYDKADMTLPENKYRFTMEETQADATLPKLFLVGSYISVNTDNIPDSILGEDMPETIRRLQKAAENAVALQDFFRNRLLTKLV